MTAANDRTDATGRLDVLSTRFMVGGGAMGARLQAADVTVDEFEAGANAVETKYVRLHSG